MSMEDLIVQMMSGRLEREFDRATSACTTSTATAESLPMDNMHERLKQVFDTLKEFERRSARAQGTVEFAEAFFGDRLMPWQRDMLRFIGMPVIENPSAMTSVPVRVHRRRRNQSEAYHRRVQKKWLKRFGMRHVPAAYFCNAEAIAPWAYPGGMLVCHPMIAAQLRKHSGGL